MSAFRKGLLLGVALVAGLAVFAVLFTRETLAVGDGERGQWKVVASWTPWQSCVRTAEPNSEGGACGFARPGTLNEASAFLVNDEGAPLTVVAGPVPPDTASIEVAVTDGETVHARIQRAGLDRFFVVELPGRRSVWEITALNSDGGIVGRLEHGPMPPPIYPTGELPPNAPPPAQPPQPMAGPPSAALPEIMWPWILWVLAVAIILSVGVIAIRGRRASNASQNPPPRPPARYRVGPWVE